MIARQPICDGSLNVVAYEILYRGVTNKEAAVISNPDNATIDVLLSAFTDHSITDVVNDKMAFINFTGNIILNNMPPIESKQLVVELLEDQEISDALIEKIKALRKQGVKIALDDFSLTSETVSLIDHADIIKLDVLNDPLEKWQPYISKFKDKGITLLAEKVEDFEMFDRCKALGFELFQGFFFAKPKKVEVKKLTRNQQSVLILMDKINQPEVDIEELTKVISHDSSLSYHLLRSVNSGLFNFHQKICSIKQAITLLGLENLRNWLSFLALSSLDNKPQILNDTAIIRAKLCEWMGLKINQKSEAHEYFTVGLLSIIDAFFDIPMEQLLKKLSLNPDIQSALLDHSGTLGKTLHCVIDHEHGIWNEQHEKFLNYHKISPEDFFEQYLDVVKSVEEAKLNAR